MFLIKSKDRKFEVNFESIGACFHIELKRHTVVTDGEVYLANAVIAATTVKECVSIFLIQSDDFREVLYRLQVLPKPLE